MGILVTIEGLDGAGKRTLVDALVADLRGRGERVATMAFPRYGESVHADLAAEALTGGHGDLAASANAMALMFALDRAGAADDLRKLLDSNDLVILDRYVASNAAYGAARVHEGAAGVFSEWVGTLEYDRFGLPVPDAVLLLDVPVDLAAERARRREQTDASRTLDAYERDAGLQKRTAEVYRELAEIQWRGQWWVVGPEDDPAGLAARLAQLLTRNG
ncbi:dTMP kinase [Aldersonia kunmingensis]|uniref:dTMP kinase n=1 Tax=Aldersonia kunmingensis TaxID=408066 RepID=UPI00082A50EA|nr:dTMP kinase [Aldersonia kunmingensis]